MKINTKAFTLIELLAVIVILAIIALIATPIVLSIINESKENARLRSAEMYLDAVEQSVSIEKMNNTNFKTNSCEIEKGNLNCDGTEVEVKVNGEVPESGSITFENGKIKDVTLTYSNGKTVVKENNKLVYGEKVKTFADICTYDSTSTVEEKKAGAKYSCEVKEGTSYNFYVLTTPAEGDTTINLIMDRNICEDGTPATAENKCLVAWLSKDDYINNDGPNAEQFTDGGPCQYGGTCSMNELGPITAMTYLNKATSTWENIDNLDLTYDDEGEHFADFELNGKARLPYKSEITSYDSTNKTNAYLYDYLNSYNNIQTNAISGINGYWALSSYADSSNLAWDVYYESRVGSLVVNIGNHLGVRAVINLKI